MALVSYRSQVYARTYQSNKCTFTGPFQGKRKPLHKGVKGREGFPTYIKLWADWPVGKRKAACGQDGSFLFISF